MRVGNGFDVHVFDEDKVLVLGGITIPDHAGLSGHSDGDAAAHAIADALLGAASLGDIGRHFPPTHRWAGASSLEILRETRRLIADAGWAVGNVDVTIVASSPRLDVHRDAMIEALSLALGTAPDRVSVKATTTDGLGFTGRGEGIAAMAVASVEPLG